MSGINKFLRLFFLVALIFVSAQSAFAQGPTVTGTTQGNTNVRAEASEGSQIIGTVPADSTIQLLQRTQDDSGRTWFLIPYEDSEGWVAGWIITVNGNSNAVPVYGAPQLSGTSITWNKPQLTNEWPLPDAGNGARFLNVQVLNVYPVFWKAETESADFSYLTGIDAMYMSPDGQEINITFPLWSRHGCITIVPGDVLRLTLGNPTEQDAYSAPQYPDGYWETIETIFGILEESLPAFAETGSLDLLPVYPISNPEPPIVAPTYHLILPFDNPYGGKFGYAVKSVARAEFSRESPLNSWPLTEYQGAYLLHVEILDALWANAEIQNGEYLVETVYVFKVGYTDASGNYISFWFPGVIFFQFQDEWGRMIFGYQPKTEVNHPVLGVLPSLYIAQLGYDKGYPITRGREILLQIGDPLVGGTTAWVMEKIGNHIDQENLKSFSETGDIELLPHYLVNEEARFWSFDAGSEEVEGYRQQISSMIIPLYVDW